MNLHTLFDYSARFRGRLRAALADLPDETWTAVFPRIGHATLRDTLLHIVGVEEEWVQGDILGRPMDWAVYAGERYPDAESVFARWDVVREATLALLAARGLEGLQTMIEIFGAGGVSRGHFRIEDVLLHVLLHEIGHRGDITTLMTLAGLDPPGLDHLALLRWERMT